MGKVTSISDKFIKAVEGPGDHITLKVTGVIGESFTGMDLASVVDAYSHDGTVVIEMDSVGGYLADAFTFYDQVRAKGLKVYVDGYGNVASAATIIMAAAGRKRSRLAPNAEYLVHNASGGDAETLNRANAKMAAIYAELTGKPVGDLLALMKQDKPISAQQAKKMGFVGEVIELQRLAAHKPTTMENENKATRVFAVDRDKALSALVTGKIELEVDVNAELTEQVGELTLELKAKATEIDEIKAELEAKADAITAKETAESALEAAKVSHLEELEKVGKEAEALRAEIKALKETPKAPKVAATAAPEAVEPGAKSEEPAPFKKQTSDGRVAAFQKRQRELAQQPTA